MSSDLLLNAIQCTTLAGYMDPESMELEYKLLRGIYVPHLAMEFIKINRATAPYHHQ
jgi:hypothetical protein